MYICVSQGPILCSSKWARCRVTCLTIIFETHVPSELQLTGVKGHFHGTVEMNAPIYAVDCTTDRNVKFMPNLRLTTIQSFLVRRMLKQDIVRYNLVGLTRGEPAYLLNIREKA